MEANPIRTLVRNAHFLSSSLQKLLNFSSFAAGTSPKTWQVFYRDPPETGSSIYRQALKSQRPSTIKWRQDFSNLVSLIGTVQSPIRKINTANGGVGACTSLAVKSTSKHNRYFRVLLKMWGAMADMCLEHIRLHDFLYVSGRLESYTKVDENKRPQTFYEVIVKEVNFVEQCSHGPTMKNDEQLGSRDPSESGLEKYRNRLHLWQVFFANPSEWHDYRRTKMKPKHPDFKHKDTGEALWISRGDPPWIQKQLQLLDSQDHKENSQSSFSNWV